MSGCLGVLLLGVGGSMDGSEQGADGQSVERGGVGDEEGMRASLMTKRHHVWPGNNTFLCDGRIMMGPGVVSCGVTLVIITAPSMAFFASTCPRLAEHGTHPAWAILAAVLLGIVLFSFVRTAICDPGIIPRREGHLDERLKRMLPKSQGIVINGQVVTLRYCSTCNIYRPPRCSHCKICDNCVDRFDHHCPWVGTCIGRRNYYWFLLFTFSSALYGLYIVFFCLRALYVQGSAEADTGASAVRLLALGAQRDWVSTAIAVFCFLSLLFTLTLSSFHVYLVSSGLTTHEHIKGTYQERDSPYSRGCCANWRAVLVDQTPAPLFDASEAVGGEGDHASAAEHGRDIELGAAGVRASAMAATGRSASARSGVLVRGDDVEQSRDGERSRTHDARPLALPHPLGDCQERGGSRAVLPGIPRVV